MGTFGNVSVQWKIVPGDTNDVTPTYGNLYFAENQTEVSFSHFYYHWCFSDESTLIRLSLV